jgi:hypothetical protein
MGSLLRVGLIAIGLVCLGCGKDEAKKPAEAAATKTKESVPAPPGPGNTAKRTSDALGSTERAQFAMSEKQIIKACGDLAKAMERFIAQLQKETVTLQEGMASDDRQAPRKFGEFFLKAAAPMEKIKADGDLGAARDELVTAIKAMGNAYIAFSKAWDTDAPDQAEMNKAQAQMDAASGAMEAGFTKLATVCTGEE